MIYLREFGDLWFCSIEESKVTTISRLSFLTVAAAFVVAASCGQNVPPAVKQTVDHTQHKQPEHQHGATGEKGSPASLMLTADPVKPTAAQPAKLRLMLHDATGKMLKDFEPTHEKLAHLIVVRHELDEFAHLHPAVDAEGNLTVDHTFPVGGKYHLFVDYKAAGKAAATAQTTLVVEGESPAAAPLALNVPGTVQGDGYSAAVSFNSSADKSRVMTFKIHDQNGSEVKDLEPYLGAMGHLVVLSSDATNYVHAHPLTETANGGTVEFEVHFPGPGLYKAWGQFQRNGQVFTIPAVVQIKSDQHAH